MSCSFEGSPLREELLLKSLQNFPSVHTIFASLYILSCLWFLFSMHLNSAHLDLHEVFLLHSSIQLHNLAFTYLVIIHSSVFFLYNIIISLFYMLPTLFTAVYLCFLIPPCSTCFYKVKFHL